MAETILAPPGCLGGRVKEGGCRVSLEGTGARDCVIGGRAVGEGDLATQRRLHCGWQQQLAY